MSIGFISQQTVANMTGGPPCLTVMIRVDALPCLILIEMLIKSSHRTEAEQLGQLGDATAGKASLVIQSSLMCLAWPCYLVKPPQTIQTKLIITSCQHGLNLSFVSSMFCIKHYWKQMPT